MCLQTTVIQKQFQNFFFQNRMDTCDFKFTFGDGFFAKEDAIDFIKELGLSPDGFICLLLRGTWYAVHINQSWEELTISRERMWVKSPKMKKNDEMPVYDIKDMSPSDIREKIPYNTETFYGGAYEWNSGLVKDLTSINRGQLLYAKPDGTQRLMSRTNVDIDVHNACVFLGCCLFDAHIPVYQLDAVANYFTFSKPGMQKLWSKGIVAINPFHNAAIRTEDGGQYYLNDWVEKLQAEGKLIGGKDPSRCVNYHTQAWRNTQPQ